MKKHYDSHEKEITEVINFTRKNIGDSCEIDIEFEYGRISHFHTKQHKILRYSYGKEARMYKKELAASIQLTEEKLNIIKQKLKIAGCISIKLTKDPKQPCILGFRRVNLDRYDFVIYSQSLNLQQQNKINNDCSLLFYRDNIVFQFGSGAFGDIHFPQKDEYLQKWSHQ